MINTLTADANELRARCFKGGRAGAAADVVIVVVVVVVMFFPLFNYYISMHLLHLLPTSTII